MSLRTRRRAGAVVLAVGLALPMLATAGPAQAAPGRSRPAAAPASDILGLLTGLVARLLPLPAPAVPGIDPGLASQVTASTVRVSGVACGERLQGSGFSPAPDTIVTNAHVVAGTTRTEVLRPDGRTLPATVTAFDPVRDLAVLTVAGLGQPSLGLGPAVVGETAAIVGHPFGQAPVEVSPARVVRRVTADVGDIYDRPATPRQILVLDAQIDPGDSGAPVVSTAGQVVGVAFAVSNLRRGTAFAVASEELGPVLARPRSGAVSTGPCLEL
ncbi:MAG TPA: trypsin-like peptidase domain-containing protein [Acidimicrobiales bacterium]|nr:trypsin-like peptidase domain-containing protein [Acidimicrobiales bacterium]